jgi:hypothetical protein
MQQATEKEVILVGVDIAKWKMALDCSHAGSASQLKKVR